MEKRTILFRGKRVDNGEWVEGSLYETIYNTYIIQKHDETRTALNAISVISNTVGQFTGLTDKNGKRVFEGDVLNGFNYRVTYKDGCFCITNEYGLVRYWLNYENCNLENLKVIGNIHDNPELS